MTVLVGILARDGAVIAADRQVTVGHVGLPMQKIAPIGGDSLVASSGSLALGQKIRMAFETHHAELKAHPYAEHLPAIEQGNPRRRHADAPDGREDQIRHPPAPRTTRWSVRWRVFRSQTAFASVTWTMTAPSTVLNENLPYVTAGSGKINADPFIRFIWDVFWPEPGYLPPLREAIFAAYWTVHMNIEYQSTGVGIGVDVWTVNRNADGSYAAAETDWARLEPSGMFIESMKQAMRAQRDRTFGNEDIPVDVPPKL